MSQTRKTVLITGAAGNLGGLLARRMLAEDVTLHLLIHDRNVAPELRDKPGVKVFRADLNDRSTLYEPLTGVDTVIHFAGVLFRHSPEKFLEVTNTRYFDNLMGAAAECGVKRVILASFPHVEGETTPDSPASGRLDGTPSSVHAVTRLAEERILFGKCAANGMEPVSLRIGMVYGRGILMVDAARWFSRHWLLGVWRKPTWIHLISTEDFLDAAAASIMKDGVSGIYHIGDEGVQTLQEFLDAAARQWGTRRPWRMPVWTIMAAARFFELWSRIFGTRSPLTVDFVRIGMASYYGDTGRMREELLPQIRYRTFRDGISTL